MNMRILRLNRAGLPIGWVSREQAVVLYVKEQVIWSLGTEITRMLGGMNRNGCRSSITLAPIIACEGRLGVPSVVPSLSNDVLFRRDGYSCMYCGRTFTRTELTRDHVVPRVQGGRDVWTNVVAACARCNHRKGGRTPEQAGMELLAVPFEPNLYEYMYLANHRICGDQMGYLQARFGGHRNWQAA